MKLFVISDTHSYFDEMKSALDEAGFDPSNENHWLIGCGDYFDRGDQSKEMYKYLMSIERKVLVKGNHDDMMIDMLERGYPRTHDYSNCTAKTLRHLAEDTSDKIAMYNKVSAKFHAIYDRMVEYFETENYIFVHSWIPLYQTDWKRQYQYLDNWRDSSEEEWQDARWHNPFQLAKLGLKPDKTIVFGHWHTSWPRAFYDFSSKEWGEKADFSIYYGDGYIGIDGCTAYTGKVNVLVLEDDFLPQNEEHLNANTEPQGTQPL